MSDLISVVVPVYNVEPYLERCLDSLLAQTYTDLEVILVNDGSTDGSGAICQSYAGKDARIRYVEKENEGIAATRNVAVKQARGVYVTFVDSDDWVERTYLEELYTKMLAYKADIVVANYYRFNESDNLFYFHIREDEIYEQVYSSAQIIDGLYEKRFNKNFALISACGKLYKRSLFDDLLYPKGQLGEDGFFNLKAYLLSDKIVYLNKGLYAYRERAGSLSRTWTEDWMHALVYAMEERLALLASRGYPLEKHSRVYVQMLESCLAQGASHGLAGTETYRRIEEKYQVLTHRSQPDQQTAKRAVVLAANHAYVDQVETTIKSVVYHNRGMRFYLINSDFPNEWFRGINRKLARVDSEIVNCRVTADQIQQYKTDISYTVFLRYFISDFVAEDRVIYMDCDMVVTDRLTPLFEMDMQGYSIAAVRDYGNREFYHRDMFNAGFLLIDNRLWKEANMSQELIDLTNKWHDQVDQADQSILNMRFEDQWLELPFDYNYVVLHDHFVENPLPLGQDYPKVIHYLSHRKPWFDLAAQTFREVWWFYHDLDWSEIAENHALLALTEAHLYPQGRPLTLLIYTSTVEMEGVEKLIQALPHCQFKIAARVFVADGISRLLRYPNVTVYSGIFHLLSLDKELVSQSDVLLDINYFEKTGEILDAFVEKGKPIIGFEGTKGSEHGQTLLASVDEMVAKIGELAKEKEGYARF